jgi:transposase
MQDTLFPLPEGMHEAVERGTGKPRLETAHRQQIEIQMASLEQLLPEDHRARMVWATVQEYDLSAFYRVIESIEGKAGRPAIDPQILVAVWLYATIEGVGSARAVGRLCEEHLAYRWLLGGVSVNYHTLADFRANCGAELDGILTRSVAALMSEGLVDLEQTAQDGVRIRASAGASSFHQAKSLEECLEEAEERVRQLKAENEEGESGLTRGQRSVRERHARERVERLKRALAEVAKIEVKKAKNRESRRKNRPVRVSTTDPEARVTKMADGGFRPAYNGQLNVDMGSRIIVGVEVSNEADQRLLEPMLEQTRARYGKLMKEHYVDGGFRSNAGIEAAEKRGVHIYAPIPERYSKRSTKRPEDILPSDSPAVAAWKRRMVTEEAKQKYKGRAATVEWANALLRNRGLLRFLVRGWRKVRAVLLWHVLAHNMIQTLNLRQSRQMTVAEAG